MDFEVPDHVVNALSKTVAAEDFGYPFRPEGDPVIRAFENTMNRQGWTPRPERTPVYTDLMQVLQVMNEHSTAAGDGIAVQMPAYPPFLATIERSGRHIVPIPAHENGSGWTFDTPDLADHLRANTCTMLLLVNIADVAQAPQRARLKRSTSLDFLARSPRSAPTPHGSNESGPVTHGMKMD